MKKFIIILAALILIGTVWGWFSHNGAWAATITVTPGGSDDNSYVELEDAETILAEYTTDLTSAWDAATDDNKNRALIQATRDIDKLNLRGTKYHTDAYGSDTFQALHFPTAETYYNTSHQIPPEVERATALQAAYLLRCGAARIAASDMMSSGIASQGSGKLNTNFNRYAFGTVCPEARRELGDWIIHGAKIERR